MSSKADIANCGPRGSRREKLCNFLVSAHPQQLQSHEGGKRSRKKKWKGIYRHIKANLDMKAFNLLYKLLPAPSNTWEQIIEVQNSQFSYNAEIYFLASGVEELCSD